jgi:hypothetical protein
MKAEKYRTIFREIEDFRIQIEEKYGIALALDVKINVLSLESLHKIINGVMISRHPQFDGEMRSEKRDPIVVMHRSIFFHFAKEYGFSITSAAKFLNKNHATAIHGMGKLEEKLAEGNFRYTKYFKLCKEAIDAK